VLEHPASPAECYTDLHLAAFQVTLAQIVELTKICPFSRHEGYRWSRIVGPFVLNPETRWT
jgi:hypothetical protein